MLVFLKSESGPAMRDALLESVRALGWEGRWSRQGGAVVLVVTSRSGHPDLQTLSGLPGVEKVLPAARPWWRGRRQAEGGGTPGVRVGNVRIGQGGLTLIAGPCAVENEDQLLGTARRVREAGADLLRGGAFKPRSSPYEFQGLGVEGLKLLARARDETGLPVVTEAVDAASLERVEEYADVIQIGARNMQNFELLKRAGRSERPVFLKRGFSARLDDLLLAAEYVLDQGNINVMLCERGIRTFSDHSRFTLDLSVIPALREATCLPLFVDPSHAVGLRDRVPPMARAAVAAGADGVMLEVHPSPESALCDGAQSLRPDPFRLLADELRSLHEAVAKPASRGAVS